MKAEITKDGVLVLTPQSSTEEYALKKWRAESEIIHKDLARRLESVYRGDRITITDEDVCPNCEAPMPKGCGGVFKEDGKHCLLNSKQLTT